MRRKIENAPSRCACWAQEIMVNKINKRKIVNTLTKALLQEGEMNHMLYEAEVEMYIEDWYQSLFADHDEFAFAILEESDQIAMAIIMRDKTVYVNEAARQKLTELWPTTYNNKLQQMIPMMADILADGVIFFTGVKTV